MFIINRADSGTNTYIVSVQTGFAWTESYQVNADDEEQAKERLADFLSEQKFENLYYTSSDVEALISCSGYKDAQAFADAHNLECRGHDKIYIEFVDIKMI